MATRREKAEQLVRNYTLLAMATGAVPIPGASFAIIGENASMIAHIAAVYGTAKLSVQTVATTLGVAGLVNVGGRAFFLEAARLVLAFAGPYALPLIMGAGATTAGTQTWILGHIAIAMAESDGELKPDEVKQRVREAAASFGDVASAYKRGERASETHSAGSKSSEPSLRCPVCGRQYSVSERFCSDDGTGLVRNP